MSDVPEVGKGRGSRRGRASRGVTSVGQSSVERGRGRGTDSSRGVTSLGQSDTVFSSSTNTTGLNAPTVTRGRRSRGRGVSTGGDDNLTNSSSTNNFEQAYSTNLPVMSYVEVAAYFQTLRSPELRQAKDERSGSADYGDNAVGYVKVRRDTSICIVEARVTLQTSINKKAYEVGVHIDETNKRIIRAYCNCQASMGNCKHETALIFWLLRRSEDPTPTEVACYWRKSILSTVKQTKAKTIEELSKREINLERSDDSLLKMFIEVGKENNKEAGVIRYELCKKEKKLYLDHLFISFTENYAQNNVHTRDFCSKEMTPELCQNVFVNTTSQSTKAEWYYQRFGRITASKLFEVSRCSTRDGSLVASIMDTRMGCRWRRHANFRGLTGWNFERFYVRN